MNPSSDGVRPAAQMTASETRPSGRNAGRSGVDGVEHLSTAECWTLIEEGSFGRLAVVGLDSIPDVFPVNYTVHDGSIYIRSAPGSKLRAIAVHPAAAFELDGEDAGLRWSVVLRGTARRLAFDKEIRESGVQALVSSSPTAKYNYIAVTPSSVSGRRFIDRADSPSTKNGRSTFGRQTSAPEPTGPHDGTETPPLTDSERAKSPVPIAHFSPR